MFPVFCLREAGHVRHALDGTAVPLPLLSVLHVPLHQGRTLRTRQDEAVQGKQTRNTHYVHFKYDAYIFDFFFKVWELFEPNRCSSSLYNIFGKQKKFFYVRSLKLTLCLYD